jgi:hypothetical protein
MHAHLLSYLRDHRDQIIENWLTEVEVPAPSNLLQANPTESGSVPYAFFEASFEAILAIIQNGPDAKAARSLEHSNQLNEFLGKSCECRERCAGGRVCVELHDSGLHAIMAVFGEEWDAEKEFSELDKARCKTLINKALSDFFSQEIQSCQHRTLRNDCPFVAFK